MEKTLRERFATFEGACKGINAVPELLFARGTVGGKPALVLMSGPRLDLDKLAKLRAEVIEVLDQKEQQLKGNPGAGTINVSF